MTSLMNSNRHVELCQLSATASVLLPALSQETRALEQLPAQQRSALERGPATVIREEGQFIGRVLIRASESEVWDVLTDYDNFKEFIPDIESSRLLDSSGDRRVFEQINIFRFFLVTLRSRIVIESLLNYPRHIDFRLVEGDLDGLRGTWCLKTIPASRESQSPQVLLTQQVAIEPRGSSSNRGVFYDTYRDIMQETLVDLKQESERRSRQRSHMTPLT
ncbi:MAG: SRPBCC family protein [Cyanobacteria bacterium J06627_8]